MLRQLKTSLKEFFFPKPTTTRAPLASYITKQPRRGSRKRRERERVCARARACVFMGAWMHKSRLVQTPSSSKSNSSSSPLAAGALVHTRANDLPLHTHAHTQDAMSLAHKQRCLVNSESKFNKVSGEQRAAEHDAALWSEVTCRQTTPPSPVSVHARGSYHRNDKESLKIVRRARRSVDISREKKNCACACNHQRDNRA